MDKLKGLASEAQSKTSGDNSNSAPGGASGGAASGQEDYVDKGMIPACDPPNPSTQVFTFTKTRLD